MDSHQQLGKDFKQQFKVFNARHKQLRQLLGNPDNHTQAIELLLHHHATLHSEGLATTESWSFADAVFDGLATEQARAIPNKEEHSIAWLFWHMARIEDVAMNTLVAGSAQVLNDEWQQKLRVSIHHSGNAMHEKEVQKLSSAVNISALRAYRRAVGRQTQEIVKNLPPETLNQAVDPIRVQQVMEQGDLREAASGIADYWGRRTIAGLLLMPATRHNMVHLNEAFKIKKKVQAS